MKKLIQLEELGLFIVTLLVFPSLNLSWWWFTCCILLPDISMMGYLHNSRTGAWSYNLFHHRAVALCILLAGYLTEHVGVSFIGLILFSHATLDRIFGYGLKYERGFKFTHLGQVGVKNT